MMDPLPADLDAFAALSTLRGFDRGDSLDMRASYFRHNRFLSFVQHFVYEGDRNRSFAYSRRNALYTAATNIADREHTRQTGFQQIWRANERPTRGVQIVPREIRACLDETSGIHCDTSFEPLRAGNGASHQKDMSDIMSLDAASLIVSQAHSIEMLVPFQSDDFRLSSQHD